MKKYELRIADDVGLDIDEIVERKKTFGTYQSNIEKFLEEIDLSYERLETSPTTGSNLSARVDFQTKKKYFVIQDYLMIYEIIDDKIVHVSRILPAKSNWQRTLL
ncbi:MAG: type II toxin-antitoxin system mRNA interferase toxin, RelE/StbE family [Defluviitaleaceae bacterium]|nr:type II toxin-antitoxin system mRNA interferase toxin, RelE/StbE family [Defluviitaleaceae bacterium]